MRRSNREDAAPTLLDDTLKSLHAMTKNELLQVQAHMGQLLGGHLARERTMIVFYQQLQKLLGADGIRLPPIHVPAIQKLLPLVRDAQLAIGMASPPGRENRTLKLAYSVAKLRLRQGNAPLSFVSICQQLRDAQALLDSAFPGYAHRVLEIVPQDAGNFRG